METVTTCGEGGGALVGGEPQALIKRKASMVRMKRVRIIREKNLPGKEGNTADNQQVDAKGVKGTTG
jgi:hypothetical protein